MSSSSKNTRAPVIRRTTRGIVKYSWRTCPWATNDFSGRIPTIERADHLTTSGSMAMQVRDGHDKVGFVCLDSSCPYLLGTATTQIYTVFEMPILNRDTGEYTVSGQQIPIPLCSGVPFFEY